MSFGLYTELSVKARFGFDDEMRISNMFGGGILNNPQ
jgi:hypothetical protein